MELSQQEQEFFQKGGEVEIADTETEATETTEVSEDTAKTEVSKDVSETEKKKPSKFEYSPDTDNVVDDLGRKYVPLNAIQEARNENKDLRKQLKEQADKFEVGNKRLNEILQRISGAEKEASVPKYEENPLEHLRASNEALQKELATLKEGHGRHEKLSEQQVQLQRFHQAVSTAEAKFSESQKDYAEAVNHIRNLWAAEFSAAGVSEDQLEAAVSQRGAQLAFAAMQRGMNPAQAVYELSQKVGYKQKASESTKDKQNLKTIAEGQEASKSLASGKGDATLSLESMSQWSEEQFEEFISDPKKWKQLNR